MSRGVFMLYVFKKLKFKVIKNDALKMTEQLNAS
jgi:hypothetical protein